MRSTKSAVPAGAIWLVATLALPFLPPAFGQPIEAVGSVGPGSKPNIVLILTDDQTMDAIPHSPAVMPFLQSQIDDPAQP
jgi:hypothetical protein